MSSIILKLLTPVKLWFKQSWYGFCHGSLWLFVQSSPRDIHESHFL
uniref:Uncharacterized protein n=1 Tax=Anguilla anguilla TaxID=7936 RepID=A0A0E9W9S4_ANGAN